ncbi:MAG: aminoglycoside phosphotransferase family protein [Thermomicrobiales bacterium]
MSTPAPDIGMLRAALTAMETSAGPLVDLTPLEAWGPTVVVAGTSASGYRLVLKASARSDVRIEAATARRARNAGVPTPAILAEGADIALPGAYWFLMDRATGVRWADLDWPMDRQRLILHHLADIFVRLHGIAAEGSGPLTGDGRGTFPDWPSWLAASFDEAGRTLVDRGLLSAQDVARVGTFVDTLRRPLLARPSSLLHADLGDGEVFVDAEARVTGIVDWGSSIAGDPLYEFARFVAGGSDDDPRPARYLGPLLERYAERIPAIAAADPRLPTLYRLHNTVLNTVWAAIHAPDWLPALTHRIARLTATLADESSAQSA